MTKMSQFWMSGHKYPGKKGLNERLLLTGRVTLVCFYRTSSRLLHGTTDTG